MSDRFDPSQYPTAEGDQSAQSFFGDTSMNNHQIQSNPSGVYAEPDEMLSYENTGVQDDYMTRNPGRFSTKVTGTYNVATSRNLPGASGPILTAPAHVSGWGVRETSGVSNALIRFRDGADGGSPALITISLAPGESARDFLTLPIQATRALYLEIVSGTVEGNLFTVERRYV
jgi:hypothetical protein